MTNTDIPDTELFNRGNEYWSCFLIISIFFSTLIFGNFVWRTLRRLRCLPEGYNVPSRFLISLYERLSVMHRQARLPEILTFEIWTDLGTLGFDFPEQHPPPGKLKFRQILALWVLMVGVCGD